jgi:diacylglycerol kinase family enzyme
MRHERRAAPLSNNQPRVFFILNGKSGSCDPENVTQAITSIASRRGIFTSIDVLHPGSDISAMVRLALEDGADIVAAGGGDGTISAVASALVGSTTSLGVLPLGTLNHFAKDLLIPLDLEQAIANVFEGRERSVDVGEVNGRIFLNNSGIGLYPSLVLDREASQKRGLPKWLAFLAAAAKRLKTHKLVQVSFSAKEGHHSVRATPFVFVGNNRYEIAGLRIGARETLEGGRLWVCLAPEAGRATLLALATRAALGLLKDDDLEIIETTELQVVTRRGRREIAMDGEVTRLDGPLRYRCLPKALRVITPAANGPSDKKRS